MSDAYRELVEGLRDAVVQPSDGGEATRRRILRDLKPAPARPRRLSYRLVLVAASLALSTAFALYVANDPASRAVRPPRAAPPIAVPAPSVAPSAASTPTRAPLPTSPVPRVDTAPGPDAGVSAVSASAHPSGPARRARRASAAVGAKPSAHGPRTDAGAATPSFPVSAAPAINDAQRQALYLEAHRLHFRGAPQRALEAWQAYLASDPQAPLRLEAEYNRAVVLLRLGRVEEARRVLVPFASGAHGAVHRADAQALLLQVGR